VEQAQYGREVGLLRVLVAGVEILPPVPHHQFTQEFLQAERIAIAQPDNGRLIVIRKPSAEAFLEFLDSLVSRSPAMERGTIFANVRKELMKTLADYVGRDAASIGPGDVAALDAHFEDWFGRLCSPRRVFVPCVISPWAAPRFSVGPADFIFINDIVKSDFYPPADDLLGRDEFGRMLEFMKEGRANWLARISVEGCERFKAEEIGALSADLAVVALQLAIPLSWGTRKMGRLDARRGLAERRTISESGGFYAGGWSRVESGTSIGTGTLADTLQKNMPLIVAVGKLVNSFATGQHRLPKLERAWCDAAYWLHEALAEIIDTIGVVKLETALEVLLRAGNTSGSQARLEAILATFYGLKPGDPITSESAMTAKQFAKGIVGDRSQILHGTWSTLHSRLAMNRSGVEGFVIEVVRRAAWELEGYANSLAPRDDLDTFLAWVRSRQEP
jgi:hypothetical protein